ncbi:hypothetical protein GCM10011506_30190 [Marivirga lumbricoides]|uniref:Replication protein n=1 Tax=Marivirga lumbricoides TaxID=1046115 RepID=A0ABQ1MPL3_9BACT|nr:hypothetical protein GCM10011506_30190 [Marivirga lumbricoides]
MIAENFNAYHHFDFQSVFTATKVFIDEHNEKHPQLTEKLNANHRATCELIIRLYLKQLNNLQNNYDKTIQKVQGFKTFNTSLASCKGCTVRTILNHKARLKMAGFIIAEENRGAQGIELWINTSIIFPNQSANKDASGKKEKKRFQLDGQTSEGKNFHPLVHVLHEQKNNNSNVDRLEDVLPQKRDHHSELPEGELTRTLHEPHMNTGENAKSVPNNPAKPDGADRISLLFLIRQFWEFSRKLLYPDLILSQPEQKDIMNMIWATVYMKLNSSLSKEDWLKYHEQAIERVIMVRKWLDKSPNHWVPPPHIYFSPHNDKNDFQKTLKWLVKREILKTEISQQLMLQKVRNEHRLHEEGKGRYKHLSRLQLFRLQEQRLSKMNNPELLKAYYLYIRRIF